MFNHDDVQAKLKRSLQQHITNKNKEWSVSSEEHIVPPVTPGSRRVDVAIHTAQSDQRGYAFEIKTDNSQRYRLFYQLRDYLIAGFRPILVAPESFLAKTLPREPRVSLNWVTDRLYTSFVAVVESNPLELQLVEDRLLTEDDLRIFFQE